MTFCRGVGFFLFTFFFISLYPFHFFHLCFYWHQVLFFFRSTRLSNWFKEHRWLHMWLQLYIIWSNIELVLNQFVLYILNQFKNILYLHVGKKDHELITLWVVQTIWTSSIMCAQAQVWVSEIRKWDLWKVYSMSTRRHFSAPLMVDVKPPYYYSHSTCALLVTLGAHAHEYIHLCNVE